MAKGFDVNVNISYPETEEYEIHPSLIKLNLDEIGKRDIENGRGFRITTSHNIKKDITAGQKNKKDNKSENSIFSTKFGETINDDNPFNHRYKCECGHMRGKKYSGTTCPKCHKIVKFVDDDFTYFGYIIIDDYCIIHPIIYRQIDSFIGTKGVLDRILNPLINKDKDGNVIYDEEINHKNEPFYGIGLVQFKRRFKEIMDYYLNKNKSKENKVELYNDIMSDVDLVFTHTIPVYTTHLRPLLMQGKTLKYDKANDHYYLISNQVCNLNKISKSRRNSTSSAVRYLANIQAEVNKLSEFILETLQKKTGDIRNVFAGRYSFTARAVIVPKPGRVDEIELPYTALSELLQQSIINILVSTARLTPNEAFMKWDIARNDPDSEDRKIIKKIIWEILRSSDRGVPVLLNRNPTIEFGSIQQFFATSMNESYTIGIPNQLLEQYAADYDGDTMNVFYITNKAFRDAAIKIFNPRNAFYVSHNDGYMNRGMIHNKDLLVNMNSLRNITNYSNQHLELIRNCLQD